MAISKTHGLYRFAFVALPAVAILAYACSHSKDNAATGAQQDSLSCSLVQTGFGDNGTSAVHLETFVSGLEVPWGLAFLPGGDALVTERPGRLRLIKNGALVPTPVAQVNVVQSGEGGLLGIALHPQFSKNSLFYVYYTTSKNGTNVNRVEQYRLSSDHTQATATQIIIDDIPAGSIHNGGRIHFGPDGMLYVGTGDTAHAALAQDTSGPNGKILRLSPDGTIPADNPEPGQPWFIRGIRNTQGFDWLNSDTLVVTDHGPTGEYQGRYGGDEISIAHAGDNLGWPTIWHCEQQAGLVTPILAWDEAVPPGGAAIYKGSAIPEWTGNLIVGTLGSEHLHRVVLSGGGALVKHEVYFQGEAPQGAGRLRDVVSGPDGELYVTTSNCDGRGVCPSQKDSILRVRPN